MAAVEGAAKEREARLIGDMAAQAERCERDREQSVMAAVADRDAHHRAMAEEQVRVGSPSPSGRGRRPSSAVSASGAAACISRQARRDRRLAW